MDDIYSEPETLKPLNCLTTENPYILSPSTPATPTNIIPAVAPMQTGILEAHHDPLKDGGLTDADSEKDYMDMSGLPVENVQVQESAETDIIYESSDPNSVIYADIHTVKKLVEVKHKNDSAVKTDGDLIYATMEDNRMPLSPSANAAGAAKVRLSTDERRTVPTKKIRKQLRAKLFF